MLFLWLAWSMPLLIRWVGVEVPIQKSEVWSSPYTDKFGKRRISYRTNVFYRWKGRSYEREFWIERDSFARLKRQERLKVAFLPLAPAESLLEGEFKQWTDRAALSFMGLIFNLAFWLAILGYGERQITLNPWRWKNAKHH